MPSDSEYLERLVRRGRVFTYRTARNTSAADGLWEISRDKWTEWFAEAEATVNRLAAARPEITELLRKAKRLEISGELSDDFYESRELAINALLLCAARLPTHGVPSPVNQIGPETPHPMSLWSRFGREIVIGVVVTVIGGIILALLL